MLTHFQKLNVAIGTAIDKLSHKVRDFVNEIKQPNDIISDSSIDLNRLGILNKVTWIIAIPRCIA